MKKTKFTCLVSMVLFILSVSNVQLFAQIGSFGISGSLTIGSSNTEIELASTAGPGIGHDHVLATVDLTIGGTLTIVLDGYTPNDADQFEIMDFGGTLTGTFSSIVWPASMSNWYIDYGVNNPNKITIYGPLSALPVELLNFRVENTKEGNILRWQTASEIDNDYFQIEYSKDGKSFVSIDQVAGKGNRNDISSYDYTHSINDAGMHYYRLKQVDVDGAFEYSNLVSVEVRTDNNDVTVYPNPTSGVINFNKVISNFKVYNMSGQLVLELKNPGSQADLSQLSAGQYYLSIDNSIEKSMITIIQE